MEFKIETYDGNIPGRARESSTLVKQLRSLPEKGYLTIVIPEEKDFDKQCQSISATAHKKGLAPFKLAIRTFKVNRTIKIYRVSEKF
jgi:hypothetical protein